MFSKPESEMENKRDVLQVEVMKCNWEIKQMHDISDDATKKKLKEIQAEKKRILDSPEGKELNADLTFDKAGQFLLETFAVKIKEITMQLQKVSVGSTQHTDLSSHLRELNSDQKELTADLEIISR